VSVPRLRGTSAALIASVIVILVLVGASVAIWNLIDTREPVPPVQLAP